MKQPRSTQGKLAISGSRAFSYSTWLLWFMPLPGRRPVEAARFVQHTRRMEHAVEGFYE